jgi:hypothetical protein
MATWKKVIVSGSNANLTALQVDNLTSGQVVIGGGSSNLSTTAINGTGNIVATTGASGLVHSGSFSGSFQGNGSGLTGVTAGSLTNALTIGEGLGGAASYNGSAAVTISVSGAADLTNNIIPKWNNTDNKFAVSSITDNGTTVSGTTSIQFTGANSSLTGSFTGSFKGDGSGLTGIATTLNINAETGGPSTVSLASQTLTINGTANEVNTSVSGQTITIGLPNDVTIGNNLTVTGDLTVNGTTTYINTQDLYVEDKFILLASGSAGTTDGGIIIDRGSEAAGNIAFGFDSATGRWGFQDGLIDTTNALDPTSASGVSGSFMSYVFTEASHGATKPVTGEFAKEGAIYTNTDGTIWIYA